ncbi:hypothetical protein M6B38_159465 [Iris pallida]|uniref:Uncharacterized protein n=1 Tax=Iris pallida TaxID=29817 RepID=A0AAX6F0J6_IRIPA|nr:hypothetical protein M6B38_159465 [Iris pallida]
MHNHDKFLTAQYSLTSLSLSTFSSLFCHCCGRTPPPIASSFAGNLAGVPPSKERHHLPEISHRIEADPRVRSARESSPRRAPATVARRRHGCDTGARGLD